MKTLINEYSRNLSNKVLTPQNTDAVRFCIERLICKLLPAAWLIIAILFPPSNSFAKPSEDKPLANISVVSIDGDTLSLQEICKDKPSFIYFWATWCKTCSKEMTDVFKLQNEFDQDVHTFGIAWKDNAETIKAYFNKRDAVLKSYIDCDGSVFASLGISKTPTMMIIDEKGNIVFSGFASFRKLKRILNKQIKQLHDESGRPL